MVSITDIYYKIDSNIVSHNFWEVNIEEKKKLIDTELKKYIISKLQELNLTRAISSESSQELSVNDLLQILASNISQEQHFDTLRHFTHYIIQVAGTLQNWSIIWWVEDEEDLIQLPLIEFNESGLWTNVKTHEKTDYVRLFNFVYDVFNNNFLVKNTPKKLVMRLPKNKE